MQENKHNFNKLYLDYQDKIYRICHAYLYHKADIQDLFQEVMLNIWRNLDSFRGEAHIGTWIYRITVNTCFLYNKQHVKQKNRIAELDVNHAKEIQDDSPQNTDEEKCRQLQHAISSLNENERIIAGLLLEGLSYQEMADILGISQNYVGVKINRIKAKLKKMMEGKQWIQ